MLYLVPSFSLLAGFIPRGWAAKDCLADRFVALQQVCRSADIQRAQLPACVQEIKTPLRWSAWNCHLRGHQNRVWVDCLLRGITNGVKVGFDGRKVRSARKNLPSASEKPEVIRDYIGKELRKGNISGPWPREMLPQLIANRFGVIPKSNGKWRLIVDLSFPEGCSVNEGIDKSLTGMVYSSVVDAAQVLLRLGKGALLAKVDVASAYRIIPVHPEDRMLLGMSWEDKGYVDNQLPFGLSSAPVIFNAYADGLEWILRKEGVSHVLHYLDDFLVMGHPACGECQSDLSTVMRVCEDLGVPLAEEKLEGPVKSIQFLGFILDTVRMEIRLPESKLSSLLKLLEEWTGRKSCLKNDLEQLLGKLNHACVVIPNGRIFLRRMYNLLGAVSKGYYFLRLNQGFRSDLAWWSCFLLRCNGRSFEDLVGGRKSSVVFASDASGSWGCGAVWGEKWLQGAWPVGWDDVSIMVKELCPIVCACAVWGASWRGQSVLCECDNLSVVCAVNSGTAKEKSGVVMHMLRSLFFIVSFFGFSLKVKHVAGKLNGPADAVSRNEMDRFFLQVPTAVRASTPIPEVLWNLVVIQRPDWLCVRWREVFSALWQRELLPQQQSLMGQVDAAMRVSVGNVA